MIFLAVTMVFFAENIREHVADGEKERIYMEGLLQNLAKDTAAISSDIGFKEHCLSLSMNIFPSFRI
jgi:hypothetical protein